MLRTKEEIKQLSEKLVGLDLYECNEFAQRYRLFVRICESDQTHNALTQDFRADRINVKVVNGIIDSIKFIG